MKKLLFGIIATVLFSFTGNAQKEIKLVDYGPYHNHILTIYFSKFNLKDEASLNIALDHLISIAINEYPGQFDNIDIPRIKNIFLNQTINGFDYFKIWNNRKNILLKEKLISQNIVQLMDDSYSGKYTYEKLLETVTAMQSLKTTNTNDANALTVLKSVLISSHNFWISNGTNTSNRLSTKDLADIGGALMFFESGPLSILAGAACSAFFP